MSEQPAGHFYGAILFVERASNERRLWIKVLELAIEDLREGQADAILGWIETPEFGYVCRAAGCSPGRAREQFLRLHRNNQQEAERGSKAKNKHKSSK